MINSVYSSSKVEGRRSKYKAKIPVSSRTHINHYDVFTSVE